jgi:hypothetical protein
MKYDNDLTPSVSKSNIVYSLAQDIYVDPATSFVYVDDVLLINGGNYVLGSLPSSSPTALSNNFVSTGIRDFLIYRTNDDVMLNAASSSCPILGTLPPATTPVSIAGNSSELSYYVHSGIGGFGDWRMKSSSASTPTEHNVANVIEMS